MNELEESVPVNKKDAVLTRKKVIPLSVISEAIEETMDEWDQFYNVVTGEITSIPSSDNEFVDWSEYEEESEPVILTVAPLTGTLLSNKVNSNVLVGI
jgi:hypothetical protein